MTDGWPPATPFDDDPLERARQDLLRALAGLKEEHCRAHPDPGQPSIQEALAVLVAYERAAERALTRDEPPHDLSLDDTEAAIARGNQLMLPALIHDLNAARHATLRTLNSGSGRMQEAVKASLARAIMATVARVNRNAELLSLR